MPTLAFGLPRKDRRGCDYEAYVPDQLAGRTMSLTGDTAGEVADAERAVERINRDSSGLADSEAVAPPPLRAEAGASSPNEGLGGGGRRPLKAPPPPPLGSQAPHLTPRGGL